MQSSCKMLAFFESIVLGSDILFFILLRLLIVLDTGSVLRSEALDRSALRSHSLGKVVIGELAIPLNP